MFFLSFMFHAMFIMFSIMDIKNDKKTVVWPFFVSTFCGSFGFCGVITTLILKIFGYIT